MFAKVESGSVKELLKGNKGFIANNNQYPASVFTLWTEAERNAIGIYTIEIDNTNLKNTEWYINTDITYAYDSSTNKVKGTYGTATAKAHADTLYTEQNKTDGEIPADKDVGDVATDGLKTVLIRQVKQQAEGQLNKTDWYVIRKADTDEAVPSAIATHRAAVRSKQAEMETAITNASDTPALETLYARNSEGVRPIGDIPSLED